MRRWFLPRDPDVLRLLRDQAAVTSATMVALLSWSEGDEAQAQAVRDGEHEADDAKRALQSELRAAFATPLDPEDIYELSERLDEVLAVAKDLVREAEVLTIGPDTALVDMVRCAAEGVDHLEAAIAALPSRADDATSEADAAKRAARRVEHSYRTGMSALLGVQDVSEQFSRRELYRRASHLSEAVIRVAERIWYSIVKQT